MKINDVVKRIPKEEEWQLTYRNGTGKLLWIITKAPGRVASYKLYKVVAGGYKLTKTSREPLFREVMA